MPGSTLHTHEGCPACPITRRQLRTGSVEPICTAASSQADFDQYSIVCMAVRELSEIGFRVETPLKLIQAMAVYSHSFDAAKRKNTR